MIRIASVLLVVAVALLTASPAAPQGANGTARLKSDIVVTGELVRIGDLFENAGPVAGIAVFRAPDLGETGAVPAARVVDAVVLHGLIEVDTAGITDVVVRRASRVIAVKEIEARIARALAVRYGLGEPKNLTVSFDRDVRTIRLEPSVTGDLQPTRVSYDTRSGRFDAAFEIADNAGSRVTLRYTGAAIEMFDAVVPTRALARGEVVKALDLMIERRPKAEFGLDIVRDAEHAVGLAARRALRAGQPLRAGDLMKPEIVQRNEPVTLVYQVPGIVLTVHGKALETGSEGDLVNVLNTQSKRTVQGTVIGPGRVSVGATVPRSPASAAKFSQSLTDGAARRRTE